MTEAEKKEVAKIIEMIEIGKTYEIIDEVVSYKPQFENISNIIRQRQIKINTDAYDRIAKLFELENPDELLEKYFTRENFKEVAECICE